MIFDPKIFYKTYLDDFHKFKVILYDKILSDIPKFEKEFFGQELEKEERDAFRRSIKSDMRQTYFHAIESFFEIFFALLKNDVPNFEDVNILFNLTYSNWKTNYERITKIASGEFNLDFLDTEITYQGYKISIGHYLFYYGAFSKTNFSSDFFEKVKNSIDAIKFGIKLVAKDFSDRDEYNSYKHGLRLIPVTSELMLADPKTRGVKIRWNLEDSMSFYLKTKDPNKLKIKTKLFDTNRDYEMTYFCSNMISNMIYYRQVSFYKDQMTKNNKSIGIAFFGREEIEGCSKMNVEIQDIIYTVRKVDSN